MQSPGRYLIGIDLGTTNSAVAYIDAQEPARGAVPKIHIFRIPQLVAEGEIGESETLPSFLYFASEDEAATLRPKLPWQQGPAPVTGILARAQGSLVPGRQVGIGPERGDRNTRFGPPRPGLGGRGLRRARKGAAEDEDRPAQGQAWRFRPSFRMAIATSVRAPPQMKPQTAAIVAQTRRRCSTVSVPLRLVMPRSLPADGRANMSSPTQVSPRR